VFPRRDPARDHGTERDRVQGLVLQGGIDLELFWVNWLDKAIDGLVGPEHTPASQVG
jgi:hypothetical protein